MKRERTTFRHSSSKSNLRKLFALDKLALNTEMNTCTMNMNNKERKLIGDSRYAKLESFCTY